jgi:hypothetical protein
MQLRRRYCRHVLVRSSVYLLICFAIITIITLIFYLDVTAMADQYYHGLTRFIIDREDLIDMKMKLPMNDVDMLNDDYFNATRLACRYPKLKIDNPDIWKHLSPVIQTRPDCEKSLNWVYVENGRQHRLIFDLIILNYCLVKEHFDYRNKHCKSMVPLFVPIVRYYEQKTTFRQWKVLVYFLLWTKCLLCRTFSVLIVEHVMEAFIQTYIQALCSMLVFI